METASDLLAPGRQIAPGLQLVRELGQGGMGSVWIAHHASLRSDVAVKFLAEHSRAMPDAVERFSLEAAAAARVRSPHVVQVFDHGISEGTPYIVMELLEGEDLSRRLEREERLSHAETIAIIDQICKALERAHALGIVHRDIKPANVFLMSTAQDDERDVMVKVLDFGLAKHSHRVSELTANGAIFGTPHYISPEQAGNARSVTPQSDLWSVAVIAYQCLTGRRPYPAESLIELCAALAAARFDPPTTMCPELPRGIDEWFVRAFKREPKERFASASELAETFAAAFEPKKATRRPWFAAAGLVAIAAVTFAMWPKPHPVAAAEVVVVPAPPPVVAAPVVEPPPIETAAVVASASAKPVRVTRVAVPPPRPSAAVVAAPPEELFAEPKR